MKAKIALLSVMVILMLALQFIPYAYALEMRTIPYQYFNNTMTFFTLNHNYTDSWTVYITNCLTYNTTTAGRANIRLSPEDTTVKKNCIELHFEYDGDLFIYYSDETETEVGIGSGKWVSGEAVVVCVTADGIINVGNKTDRDSIVKNYGAGSSAVDLYKVGAASGSGAAESVATAGYMNIEVGGYSSGANITSVVTVWLPIIVSIAMLGMVLGIIKQLGS